MKWFKHFSDSLDDPFIQELLDEFGPHGYLAWFGILEIIAKENGSKLTGNLEIKPSYVARKLRVSSAKLERVFNHCSTMGKLSFKFSKEKWIFSIPKLLILKDNYIKDLQVCGKKPSHHKEVEVDKEIKEYSRNSNEYRLANLHLGLIKKRNPKHKDPNIQSWAKAYNLLLRADKRDLVEVEGLLRWCQSDPFWQNNILSPTKFRKQYDQMKLKKNSNGNGAKEGQTRYHQRCHEKFESGQWVSYTPRITA